MGSYRSSAACAIGDRMSLVSSACIRSPERVPMRPVFSRAAEWVSGSSLKPSAAEKRTPRCIRRASSSKRREGLHYLL